MNSAVDTAVLVRLLDSFSPDESIREQVLGLMSATIAADDQKLVGEAFRLARRCEFARIEAYELVLQSYLFLGFPRMLNAAETLHSAWPEAAAAPQDSRATVEPAEPSTWLARGESLCRRVYGDLYDPLKRKVESFAPDIFYWMVLEGYGKVLSREPLAMAERELSIIAFLIIDHRPRQLHSHIRGAINCGVEPYKIQTIVDMLGSAAPDRGEVARSICRKLGID